MNQEPQNFTEWLWQVAEAEFVDRLADIWQQSITHLNLLYMAAFLTLTAIFGTIAYFLDLRPSMQFAAHVLNNTDADIPTNVAQMLIVGLTLTPTLIEMFATGFAVAGNRAVKFTLFIALTFDMLTDAPGAYEVGQIVLGYFLPADIIAANPIAYKVMSWAAMVIILPFATIIIETLFLSCVLASWRMFKTIRIREKTQPRPARHSLGSAGD